MIHFHIEDISFTLKNKTRLKKWIVETIEKKKGKQVKSILFFVRTPTYWGLTTNTYNTIRTRISSHLIIQKNLKTCQLAVIFLSV